MVESWTCHWEGASLHPRCWTAGCEFLSMLSTESSPELPADAVCDIISWVVAKLQKQHPTHWWRPLKVSTTPSSLLHFNFLHVWQLIFSLSFFFYILIYILIYIYIYLYFYNNIFYCSNIVSLWGLIHLCLLLHGTDLQLLGRPASPVLPVLFDCCFSVLFLSLSAHPTAALPKPSSLTKKASR